MRRDRIAARLYLMKSHRPGESGQKSRQPAANAARVLVATLMAGVAVGCSSQSQQRAPVGVAAPHGTAAAPPAFAVTSARAERGQAQPSQVQWIGPYREQVRRQQAERLAWEAAQRAARQREYEQRAEAGVVWQGPRDVDHAPVAVMPAAPAAQTKAPVDPREQEPKREREQQEQLARQWQAAREAVQRHSSPEAMEGRLAGVSESEGRSIGAAVLAWSRAQSAYEVLARQYDEVERQNGVADGYGALPDRQTVARASSSLAALHGQMRRLSRESIEALDELSGFDASSRGAVVARMAEDRSLAADVRAQIASLLDDHQ
jgi:hypothetical protein